MKIYPKNRVALKFIQHFLIAVDHFPIAARQHKDFTSLNIDTERVAQNFGINSLSARLMTLYVRQKPCIIMY